MSLVKKETKEKKEREEVATLMRQIDFQMQQSKSNNLRATGGISADIGNNVRLVNTALIRLI